MKITKIEVKNFRLLKDFNIDLEDDLSVVIGKNNCGKTSLLLILDRFLNKSSKSTFSLDDFSIDCGKNFKQQILHDLNATANPIVEDENLPKISLRLFIEYGDDDDLTRIGNKLIMDLDDKNTTVVLSFEYYLSAEKYANLISDLKEYCKKLDAIIENKPTVKDKAEQEKTEQEKTEQEKAEQEKAEQEKAEQEKRNKQIFKFVKDYLHTYFTISKKSLYYGFPKDENGNDDETQQRFVYEDVFIDLNKEKIELSDIISFKYISAKRNVDNKDSDRTLSILSSNIYNALANQDNHNEQVIQLRSQLSATDGILDKTYGTVFETIIRNIKDFGGTRKGDSIIKIVSSLNDRDLLSNNTIVTYDVDGENYSLPEHYNGLGYMNLISMILEVAFNLQDFKTANKSKPADLNLFFIEEPEAHTHPQMQAIFIKNIRKLLKDEVDGEYNLQTILTTHSPHIVAESQFDDIKYLKRDRHSITCKNLKDLQKYYKKDAESYRFLKQYLTIHRADLFFADKAIFIEGDTERILLPAMMKKLDTDETKATEDKLSLLSQNISIIDIGGRHFHLFDHFISFIGIKTLIITDLDTVEKTSDSSKGKACRVSASNAVIGNKTVLSLCDDDWLVQLKTKYPDIVPTETEPEKLWQSKKPNLLRCAHQTEQEEYLARSFEDGFIHINREFFKGFINKQPYTQNLGKGRLTNFIEGKPDKNGNLVDAFDVAASIVSKSTFAIDILLHSASQCDDNRDWKTPSYIEEGLKWLQID
ncbi:ATP-dependent endonuclease [Bartonella sp. HY761]|uniref:ATP-dependent endonuclease n=1 Tax=Bartonella sp. HY761 TaxID=2979330 RepID=UPI0021E1C558|nr:ATP-dependent endonuclease [Bartonella sp. HY761]UXN08068.1 ATP-dependent endonuclease [Bartonella sp. HY761]